MKKFLYDVIIFIFIGIPLVVFIFFFFKLDGYTDPFYLRFTTPKQTSLILGNSRAAQGIEPSVVNKLLGRNDIYNYGFTISHSPYGPTYLKSIKNKLRADTQNGIFIITVDPWSICGPSECPNDSTQFPELNLALAETGVVDLNPNIFYILRSYDKPFFTLFRANKRSETMYLHKDGWLEITTSMDSVSVTKRTASKVTDYKNNFLPKYKFSEIRMSYLIRTIEFLKKHGRIYLVRLPVHPKMSRIEDQLIPDFEDRMNIVASNMGVPYKSFRATEDTYRYVDGNHLYKTSGKKVSVEIAEWMKSKN